MYTTSTIFAPIYTIFKEGARAKKNTIFRSKLFKKCLFCAVFGLFWPF